MPYAPRPQGCPGLSLTYEKAEVLPDVQGGEAFGCLMEIAKRFAFQQFDGKVQGNMSGFITSKITYDNGGHQDNVFAEIYTLCEWWNNYKATDTNEYLIALIDTDLSRQLNALKKKYITNSNIKIFSHVEFQQYIIDNY